MVRSSVFGLVVLAACGAQGGGGASPPPSASASGAHALAPGSKVERERAIELAKKEGAKEGYDMAKFELRGATLETEGPFAGKWSVTFHHVPGYPGGHFLVFVDAATAEVRLVHGK
jgi:hypothetical protein